MRQFVLRHANTVYDFIRTSDQICVPSSKHINVTNPEFKPISSLIGLYVSGSAALVVGVYFKLLKFFMQQAFLDESCEGHR